MDEHLIRIVLKDGGAIDFHKDEADIRICHQGRCVVLPHASGQQTVDLFSLLEPLGEGVEIPSEQSEEVGNEPEGD